MTIRKRSILLALALLATPAACRKRETRPSPPARTPTERPATPAAAAPAPAGADDILVEVQETIPGTSTVQFKEVPLRVDTANLARLLPGKPGLPVPLDEVRLGDPDTVARRVLPKEAFGTWEPPLFPGMCVGLSTMFEGSTDSAVTYITGAFVLLPRATARELMITRWGPPTASKTPAGEPALIWTNDLDRFQGRLVDSDENPRLSILWITPYLSLDRLVGDLKFKFGFEPIPYLGVPIQEAITATPDALRAHAPPPSEKSGSVTLTLPPLELGEDDTLATLGFENGVVTSVSFSLPWTHELRGRVGVLLARKGPLFQIEDEPGARIIIREQRADGAAPPAADASPAAVRAQCERVIDAFWRSTQAALPLLKLAGSKDLEQAYKDSYTADRLREDCAKLPAWTRKCLADAKDAIASVERCGADPFEFRPVDLVEFSKVVTWRKLDQAEQGRKLAELVGRWVDEQDFLSLEFDAGGYVDTSFTLYKAKRFRVELDHDGLAAFYDGKQFADVFTYVLEDKDTLRFCVNTAFYKHAPRIGSEDSWVTKFDGGLFVYDHGKCTAVTEYGQVVPSPCQIYEEGGKKHLKFDVPSAYWPREGVKVMLLPGKFVDIACPVLRRKPR